MKPRLLPTCLVLAPSLLAAQEPVLLSQALDLRHYRWSAGEERANASTQAVYDLMVGMPVFTYRLGSLALTSSVEYTRLTLDGRTDAATGLNRYGMRMTLFPYRPFKLQVDYSRNTTPGLLGVAPVRGESLGVGTGYRGGRWLQDVELLFRRGVARQVGEKETWTTWTLKANQHFGATEATLQAVRQDFTSSEAVPDWKNFHVNLRTETRFTPDWQLRTTWGGENSQGNRWMDGDATLQGRFGSWSSVSTVGVRGTRWGGTDLRSTLAGQSFAYQKGSFQVSSSASYTRTATTLEGSAEKPKDLDSGTYLLGTSFGLGSQWRISANAALSSQRGLPVASAGGADSRTLTTYLVGLTRGGDLPSLLRHTMFLVSDLAFASRVREDYPPGYLPAELADQLLQRRLRQQGQLGFSVDGGRTTAREDGSHLDFAHASGDLRAGQRLRFMVLADWRRDLGFSVPGVQRTERAVTGNASLLLGSVTSLTGTLGSSHSQSESLPGTTAPPPGQSGASETSYRAVSLNSRLWWIPFGVLATRYQPAVGPLATTRSGHVDIDVRQISVRLGFERARQEGLPTNNRLTVSLRRYFDTISLW